MFLTFQSLGQYEVHRSMDFCAEVQKSGLIKMGSEARRENMYL
jgi:hypothetical protein